jgi:hypothetical protein
MEANKNVTNAKPRLRSLLKKEHEKKAPGIMLKPEA